MGRREWSGSATLNADTPVSIKTAANSTTAVLYVTKVTLSITTHAAKFVEVKDTNSSAKVIAKHTDAAAGAGVLSTVTWDFGKHGVPLTAGKNLVCVSEASGVAGIVYAEGWQKES